MAKTTKPTLDELKTMLADFDPKEVRALLKKGRQASGPTMLSVTMDAIVALGLGTDTKELVADVTERARAAGLLGEGASAKTNNVTVLKRYVAAYEEAQARVKPPA